jgi:3-oxoacyl-[acyl-carrier-protein] synthase I
VENEKRGGMSVIYQLSDNIVSSLGFTTGENFRAVSSGRSGLKWYSNGELGLPVSFVASKVDNQPLDDHFNRLTNKKIYTRFEKIAIVSVQKCAENCSIDLASDSTLFILSTTKGNVRLLENIHSDSFRHEQTLLSYSATMISRFFENENDPIIISNACISGVSAQIVAKRLLLGHRYKHIVVVGAEELSKFIVSGFLSFKALSDQPCKPFDQNRKGLNIGEGAATIIYGIADAEDQLPPNTVIIDREAITNDANHISGPSRTGEGLHLALEQALKGFDRNDIGFINTHGTATLYNDEMESIALTRSGLNDCPSNSLKAYFGHTLGVSGILETVISTHCLKNNYLLKCEGYEKCGVTNPLNIITENKETEISSFVKTVSGFGGCNAVVLLKKLK